MTTDNKQGNGGAGLDLNGVFKIGDLVMMIDVFEYGVVRSMMCEGKDASKRMQEIVEQLKALSPLPKGDRSMGHEWYRACKAASKSSFYGAYMVEDRNGYRDNDFHMDVVCDGEVHRVVEKGEREEIEAALASVRQCLRDLAPVTAEPITVLKGLIDLSERVEIAHKEVQPWANKGRLDAVSATMKDQLAPATPYVHVIDASNFWGARTVVETRFAVPLSVAEDVVLHVADLNKGVLAEYSKRYSNQSFEVSMAP
ncbi:hypothetical protein O9X98_14895 [Agrobacterium salinitolerans]|nr:hypothetical protein [Agrobacterium salinitolerans]